MPNCLLPTADCLLVESAVCSLRMPTLTSLPSSDNLFYDKKRHKKLIIVRRPRLLSRYAGARSSQPDSTLSHGYLVNLSERVGRVEKTKKRLKKKACRFNLVDLVVKKATLRVPCGGRITRLIVSK